jgi:hypothetical protein
VAVLRSRLLGGSCPHRVGHLTSVAWNWKDIWPSVFLQFGATILLGALLYVVQRSFIQIVRRETRTVVEQVGARAATLEQQIGEQSARIETLADEVETARRTRHGEEDATLALITDEMTYEAVSEPLQDAERRHAISESFRVRTSTDLGGMRLYFKHLYTMERTGEARPSISLRPWFLDIRNVVNEQWSPGEDVATVISRIVAKLESANLDATTEAFDPRLVFENLRTSLRPPQVVVR